MSIVSSTDADTMFNHSVCQVDKTLVAFYGFTDGEHLQGMNVETGEVKGYTFDASKIKAPVDFQLGMLQVASQAYFMERSPARQYRVGWSSRNVRNFPGAEDIFRSSIVRNNLLRMVQKQYATFDQAWKAVMGKNKSIPFERQWAVNGSGDIYFKTEVVGSVVNGDKQEIELSRGWVWLRESLMGAVNANGK